MIGMKRNSSDNYIRVHDYTIHQYKAYFKAIYNGWHYSQIFWHGSCNSPVNAYYFIFPLKILIIIKVNYNNDHLSYKN